EESQLPGGGVVVGEVVAVEHVLGAVLRHPGQGSAAGKPAYSVCSPVLVHQGELLPGGAADRDGWGPWGRGPGGDRACRLSCGPAGGGRGGGTRCGAGRGVRGGQRLEPGEPPFEPVRGGRVASIGYRARCLSRTEKAGADYAG